MSSKHSDFTYPLTLLVMLVSVIFFGYSFHLVESYIDKIAHTGQKEAVVDATVKSKSVDEGQYNVQWDTPKGHYMSIDHGLYDYVGTGRSYRILVKQKDQSAIFRKENRND